MSSPVSHVDERLLHRVKSEFLEMPGLRLTPPQAQRLWLLDERACAAVLEALVDAQFLFRTTNGAYMRIERAPVRASVPVAERSAVA